jgi:hypothetical protein
VRGLRWATLWPGPPGTGTQDEGGDVTDAPHGGDDDGVALDDERRARLAAGLARVRSERTTSLDHRTLAVAAGVLVPLGIGLVLIGWRGASRSPNVYEQIPYLISGAELGQTLAIVGAIAYFGYWLSRLVHDHRAQTAAVLDALDRVVDAIDRLAPPEAGVAIEERLVATPRGRLVHRPDCPAVAGRTGLRTVTVADGLDGCTVCGVKAR